MSDFSSQLNDGLKAFDIWGGRVHDALGKALIDGALMVEGSAKQNVNVDTGYTRNSITESPLTEDGSELFIRVGPTAKSAPNLEWGSSPHQSSTNSEEFVESITLWGKRKGMDESEIYQLIKHIRQYGTKPHPFLGPAYYANIEKIKQKIKEALGKA
jgi:HK97 gp10 family phage protein